LEARRSRLRGWGRNVHILNGLGDGLGGTGLLGFSLLDESRGRRNLFRRIVRNWLGLLRRE
jgi:hypothetical protein